MAELSTPPVNGNSLAEILTRQEAVAVHFWAPWNAYDRKMDLTIQEVEPSFAGRVYFCSCNIDLEENQTLTKTYQITIVPTMLVFFHGKAHRPFFGLQSAEKLIDEINARLVEVKPKLAWWKFWQR